MNKIILTICFSLLLLTNTNAQEFYIPNSIIEETRERFLEDSVRFMHLLNILLISEDRVTIERNSSVLDDLSFLKFIRKHSDEIAQKLNSVDRKNSAHYRLLSLTNPTDSLREIIMSVGCDVSKARLGDSTAIAYFINEYVSRRNRDDEDVSLVGMRHFLRILLSLNSKVALDTIFNDMQSARIIRMCEAPLFIADTEVCFWTNYTYLVPIISVLSEKHTNEPLLNRRFISRFTRVTHPRDNLPLELPGFFRAIEEFILREYGYEITINVPFATATGK